MAVTPLDLVKCNMQVLSLSLSLSLSIYIYIYIYIYRSVLLCLDLTLFLFDCHVFATILLRDGLDLRLSRGSRVFVN